jgi:[acyl-carrier-protein] S-malonyltransferase
MQDAVPAGVGAMAAILKVSRDLIGQVCHETGDETGGIVEIANLNTPEQTVISGEVAAVSLASDRLKEAGARVVPLNVSAPFHCSLMQPAADKLANDLAGVLFHEPNFQVVCNVTAEVLPDVRDISRLLTLQVTAPVRWVETIEKLDGFGVNHYLEFGSGKVLTGLVGRILNKPKAIAITDMASLTAALELLAS